MIQIIPYLRNMLLKRIVTLFITFLILFADSGQMIYAHTCFKSNHTSFSLYTPKHCCAKEEVKKSCCAKKAEAQRKNCVLGKMDCCSLSSKYVKQSFPSGEIKVTVNETVKDVVAEIKLFTAYNFNSLSKVVFSSSPPLLLSKGNILFTGVFRI